MSSYHRIKGNESISFCLGIKKRSLDCDLIPEDENLFFNNESKYNSIWYLNS
jgi:hypothetical protein